MGILNILAYIGVGLAVALVLLLISYLWSRPKETVQYEDGSIRNERGEGSWVGASLFSAFVLCIIGLLLLINLAHFSFLKSLGLSLLAGIIIYFLSLAISLPFYKIVKKMTTDHSFLVSSYILCALNGTGFAILTYHWGWF